RAEEADSVGEDTRHCLVHKTPFERIENCVIAFPGFKSFHKKFVVARNNTLHSLPFEYRRQGLQLLGSTLSIRCTEYFFSQQFTHLRRETHSASCPARDTGILFLGFLNQYLHIFYAVQFEI